MPNPQSIVSDIQKSYGATLQLGEITESVSPAGMLPLLLALDLYTEDLFEEESKRFDRLHPQATAADWPEDDQLTTDLNRWRERLDWYIAQAQTPDTTFEDPEAILWTVVAPLLFGHYYGPDGDESLRPESGWPSLDAQLPPVDGATADLSTPFLLMLRETNQQTMKIPRFHEDLLEAMGEVHTTIGTAVGQSLAFIVEAAIAAVDELPTPKIPTWVKVAGVGLAAVAVYGLARR